MLRTKTLLLASPLILLAVACGNNQQPYQQTVVQQPAAQCGQSFDRPDGKVEYGIPLATLPGGGFYVPQNVQPIRGWDMGGGKDLINGSCGEFDLLTTENGQTVPVLEIKPQNNQVGYYVGSSYYPVVGLSYANWNSRQNGYSYARPRTMPPVSAYQFKSTPAAAGNYQLPSTVRPGSTYIPAKPSINGSGITIPAKPSNSGNSNIPAKPGVTGALTIPANITPKPTSFTPKTSTPQSTTKPNTSTSTTQSGTGSTSTAPKSYTAPKSNTPASSTPKR